MKVSNKKYRKKSLKEPSILTFSCLTGLFMRSTDRTEYNNSLLIFSYNFCYNKNIKSTLHDSQIRIAFFVFIIHYDVILKTKF